MTPEAVNEWLARDGFTFRWPVAAPEPKAAPVATPEPNAVPEQATTLNPEPWRPPQWERVPDVAAIGAPVVLDDAPSIEHYQTPEPASEKAATPSLASVVALEPAKPDCEPLSRHRAQEKSLIVALVGLHFNPMALPRNTPGKGGVKASVRAKVGSKGIWTGATVFDKAWERMFRQGYLSVVALLCCGHVWASRSINVSSATNAQGQA